MSDELHDTEASEAPRRRLKVAIAGGDLHAASMLRLLSEVDNITVAALAEPKAGAAGAAVAREMGIFTSTDVADLARVDGLDVILNLTEDPSLRSRLVAYRPAAVEIIGARGADFIRDLLMAKKRGEEQEKLLSELKVAYEKIRGHEHKLQVGTRALEQANDELERRLSEIFFTHEFFKALTSFTSVDDVCSLVVDGANGILGAEISAVYLLDTAHWSMRLAACQGRPPEYFEQVVSADATVLGRAYRDGIVNEPDAHAIEGSATWVADPADLASQSAVPLRTGENILGILVVGSANPRELTAAEIDRLTVIGNQSSLALHNALLHQELERLSVTDRLTELYNHGYLQQRLDEEIGRAGRFHHVLSLIMLDIDDFKRFNDTYGHPRGDRVLRAVAATLASNLRDIDFAARYGGEEFVVVLPETDHAGAVAVAERIRREIARIDFASIADDPEARVTVSIGVATYPDHANSGAALVVAADQAMYAVKHSGKDSVRSAVRQ